MAAAAPVSRRGHPIRRGHIERLRRQRLAEQRRGFRVLPLLEVELPKVHAAAHIRRIHLEYTPKRRRGLVEATLRAGGETNHVTWMGQTRQQIGGSGCGSQRVVELPRIEECDREIQLRDVQSGLELQRLPERRRSLVILILLEQRDADVVGSIRILSTILRGLASGWDPEGREEQKGQEGNESTRHSP
jgi:hypothetical protein